MKVPSFVLPLVAVLTTCCAAVALISRGVAHAALQGAPAKPQAPDPTDVRRSHVAVVSESGTDYEIDFRGTVDGTMTRSPIGYAAYNQGWQPNVAVRMENVGDTDVVNPWLIVNGRGDLRTVQGIVATATEGCATEREKAITIWRYQMRHRFHACTWDGEVDDPVKVFHVYGYTLCGDDAQVLMDLWRTAGLKVRRGFPIGHCTSEAWFDGAFHLLDGDEGIICLLRDNQTLASEEQIVRDHDLMKRTHTYNLLSGHSRQTDEFSASLQWYEGKREGEHRSHIGHTMHFTLRPNEWIEWRWNHVGKQYTAGTPLADGKWKKDGEGDLSAWGENAYANLRNGRLHYAPDLRSEAAKRGVESAEGVAWNADRKLPALALAPASPDAPAQVTWKVESPYVIVGARVDADLVAPPGADIRAEFSTDAKEWTALDAKSEAPNPKSQIQNPKSEIVLDDRLSPRAKPHYRYFVRFTMKATAGAPCGLSRLVFDTDLQMSNLCLPELTVGLNRVRFLHDSQEPVKVRLSHHWIDRTSARPPAAPPTLVSPVHGETAKGTQVVFRWEPPAETGANGLTDYHFQLSDRADVRWPLSPNFDRLLSLTPDKGKAQFTTPYVGLLNPDTPYHWRVRAKNDQGVWGPWSGAWSFQCRAPGVPLSATAHPDAAAATVTLTWQPNPQGAKPAQYKVYASDEKGFTASDTEFPVFMGRGFCDTMEQFQAKTGNEPGSGNAKTPASLLTVADRIECQVVGPDLTYPNANKAYYRVVAVDADGVESGPSDYAEAPRPFLFTVPPTTARIGQPYRYDAKSLLSLGHLTCKGGYNAAFWDREKVTWELAKAPAWLAADKATGVLSGMPAADAAGTHEVVLLATNSRGGKTEQRFAVRVDR
jgi:hypothetical protein